MASELQVNTITEATSGSGITFAKDVIPATPLSHRNMIINGAMQIAQRGTGFSVVTATGYQLDRFQTTLQGLGEYTITQNTTAPTSEGFTRSYKIDCTSADASPAATDFFFISHKIEGQNLQQLCKGTSSAKSVTLSFWCRCTKTGNIQVNLNDWDNTRLIGQAVTINSANTWEKKTLTFAGDTSGVLGNDNGSSLVVEWWLDKGSNFSGGSVPTSWEALNNANRAVGCTLALGDNTANDFYITGVQLELGSVATPFEHKSYAEELQKCYRYFYALHPKGGADQYISNAWFYSATQVFSIVRHPVEMNHAPDVESSNVTNGFQLWKNGSLSFNSISKNGSTPYATNLYSAGFSGQTAGQSFGLYSDSNDSYIYLDSEL